MKPVTLHMLLLRLAGIRRNTDDGDDLESEPMAAEIDGRRIVLTTENFQVDDDGTLLITTGKTE
ncbi:hypothetical protein [Methylogaea oryzae]|uniref:Uncharacterized protein n=1 Tax=Methylogaea oryzae TaxID=1295382 RepID=A0A8D4VMS0_9GAMM|nr:hypothetical protein [Methylogaea oryzae]BBL70357.1 hypothetical protein MoryE10_09630 [Methylogaea oryzae]